MWRKIPSSPPSSVSAARLYRYPYTLLTCILTVVAQPQLCFSQTQISSTQGNRSLFCILNFSLYQIISSPTNNVVFLPFWNMIPLNFGPHLATTNFSAYLQSLLYSSFPPSGSGNSNLPTILAKTLGIIFGTSFSLTSYSNQPRS